MTKPYERMYNELKKEIIKYLTNTDKHLFAEEEIKTIVNDIHNIINNIDIYIFQHKGIWKNMGIIYNYCLQIRHYYRNNLREDFLYIYLSKKGEFLPLWFTLPGYTSPDV